MKLIIMTLIVDICRLTVTVREGGLEAQAKLYVVVKDVNDNEPTFEVREPVHIDLVRVYDRQPLRCTHRYILIECKSLTDNLFLRWRSTRWIGEKWTW